MKASGPFDYGYKWWLYPRTEKGKYIWMGRGVGGQHLMVFPEENIIVTFTGWEIIHDEAPTKALVDRILPAVTGATCAVASP